MRFVRLLMLAAVFALTLSTSSFADQVTLTQNGFTATLNVSGNTATLTFGSSLNSYFTDQVAIKFGATTLTGGSASQGDWDFKKGNNSVNCDGSGSWFCAVADSDVSMNGLTMTWNFSGTPSTTDTSIQFAICSARTATSNCGPGSQYFVTNFSQGGTRTSTPPPPPPSVPEPATLSLIAIGLGGMYFHRRGRRS